MIVASIIKQTRGKMSKVKKQFVLDREIARAVDIEAAQKQIPKSFVVESALIKHFSKKEKKSKTVAA